MKLIKTIRNAGLIGAAVGILIACTGDGGGAPITSVKVFGDSLADGGTYGGVSATVQSGTANRTQMYPDLIASAYRASTLCQHYSATATGFAPSANAASCSNFAIGGGRVLAPASEAGELNVTKQLSDAATKYGKYTENDLLLIDGGGNDAADLVGAFLDTDPNYVAFVSRLIPNATASALVATGNTGKAQAGGAYMQALADTLRDAVNKQALNKNASYVAILNAPLVTNTPRFKRTLAYLNATNGAAVASGVEGFAKAMVQTYNARLAENFKGDLRVVIVDFYSDYNAQVANPSSYGISNGNDPACEALGTAFMSFYNCTASALSALQPSNPNWWKNYAYADHFHPTPFGHELLAANITRALKAARWIR